MDEFVIYNGAYSGPRIDAILSRAAAGGEIDNEIDALKAAVGAPMVANTAAAMTDRTKIYVYTGSETGYTNGNWYYWNGSAWVSGGVYLSPGYTFDNVPTEGSSNPVKSGGVYDAVKEVSDKVPDAPADAGVYDLTASVAPGASPVYAWEKRPLPVYGIHINGAESDPAAAVTYIMDAVGMTPAHMDFTSGRFDWGSWADAFFLPRPCMLKSDGMVDYYLDPSDYAKKADGTASDVANDSYDGNAMMEWGRDGNRIWYKIVPDAGDATSASVYIAPYQADSDYVAWPFINNQGNLVDHFYTPIYNGSIDGNGKLRSISGKGYADLCQNKTAAQEETAARLNNPSTDVLWFTEVLSDVILVNLLLILLSKTLDSQTAFGAGRSGFSGSAASNMIGTGTMDDKGLFWGSDDQTAGVKIFGMENWWGNQWRRYAGHVLIDGVQKVKYTWGTEDGSTASGYSAGGTGYLAAPAVPSAAGFITAMAFTANGFTPAATGGTSATYWCDNAYLNLTGIRYAEHGGPMNVDTPNTGAFTVSLADYYNTTGSNRGAALSCKPLA